MRNQRNFVSPVPCRGLTLIELVIVLSVLSILLAIAYPTYVNQVTKARRADGKALLFDAAQRQQQFHTINHSFTSTIGEGGLEMSADSMEGYYTLSITATATTYTLSANRVAPQTSDTKCGDLTLSHLGVKGISGGSLTADACW
ncbi:MAG: type IV pilin protein [Xanthomonadales bacterium]|nr:type IV pilin protein [Gammaproteobacteria bacterium]NNJ78098.1 type IV pilin protein [Xanthomonadales bacterium]NNK50473.1 type IV pilin protein [Xanthomonadales bacterium]